MYTVQLQKSLENTKTCTMGVWNGQNLNLHFALQRKRRFGTKMGIFISKIPILLSKRLLGGLNAKILSNNNFDIFFCDLSEI